MRRVTSTLYYAVFHLLSASFANVLIGRAPTGGLEKAWVETYRALDHKGCLDACTKIRSTTFSEELKVLADEIDILQKARLQADYDPRRTFHAFEIHRYYGTATKCISILKSLPERDMRALASWFLLHTKGSRAARREHQGAL